LKLFTVLCLLGGSLSFSAYATEDNKYFYYTTYNYALSSEILDTAAKCALVSHKLGFPGFNDFYSKAVLVLSMNLEYSSHALLEYELAFVVVKSYHYGRFSVIEQNNKDNSYSGYKSMYQELKCDLFLKEPIKT